MNKQPSTACVDAKEFKYCPCDVCPCRSNCKDECSSFKSYVNAQSTSYRKKLFDRFVKCVEISKKYGVPA